MKKLKIEFEFNADLKAGVITKCFNSNMDKIMVEIKKTVDANAGEQINVAILLVEMLEQEKISYNDFAAIACLGFADLIKGVLAHGNLPLEYFLSRLEDNKNTKH